MMVDLMEQSSKVPMLGWWSERHLEQHLVMMMVDLMEQSLKARLLELRTDRHLEQHLEMTMMVDLKAQM